MRRRVCHQVSKFISWQQWGGGGKFYGKCSVHFYARIPVGEHRANDHRWTSLFQCGGAAPIETGNRSLQMNYELAVIRNALQHLQYLLHIHILQIGYCGCGSTSSPVLFNSQQNIHEESPGDILIRRCICNIDNIWNGQSCMECRKPIFNSTPRVCLKNRWENFTNAFCSTPKRKKKKKKITTVIIRLDNQPSISGVVWAFLFLFPLIWCQPVHGNTDTSHFTLSSDITFFFRCNCSFGEILKWFDKPRRQS